VLAALLGGLTALAWSNVSWEPIGWHAKSLRTFQNDKEVAAVISSHTLEDGAYLVPYGMPPVSYTHLDVYKRQIFDRIDFQPTSHDALHLNLFTARNWFQIPNSYDEPNQDQRQKVVSFNVAPGYQHTFGTKTLLTVNPWVRRDFVNYYPSSNPFDDTPATLSQDRHLLN